LARLRGVLRSDGHQGWQRFCRHWVSCSLPSALQGARQGRSPQNTGHISRQAAEFATLVKSPAKGDSGCRGQQGRQCPGGKHAHSRRWRRPGAQESIMVQGSVLQRPTLVLNRNWQPVRVATVARALLMVWKDSARVVDPHDFQTYDWNDWSMMRPTDGEPYIQAVTIRLRVPEVVAL